MASARPDVRVRRAYEEAADDDGIRVLVDRLWPRGLPKDRAHLDEWSREVSPSPELRTWYGHEPSRFEEFRSRYQAELEEPERAQALDHLRDLTRRGTLTLLTATKRADISAATVLAEILRGGPTQPS